MAKIKIQHIITSVIEVDTKWYPEEIQDNPDKIAEYEKEYGAVKEEPEIILEHIQTHNVTALK